MAHRLGRSFYRFSSVNRPLPPPAGGTTAQESAEAEGRRFPSVTRDQLRPAEPTSPRRPRSPPYSPPTRESPPLSPTRKAASPLHSPPERVITSPRKPAAESPKFKQTTESRSPPEFEQKPKMYKTGEKPAKSYLESGKSNSHKQPNSIRIAGENLGAVMEIVQSPKKREGGHVIKKESRGIHHTSHENDEASKEKAGHKGKETTSLPMTSTFLNSNFQSVNNSLLYNATLAHHDPGLHLAFSRKPTGDGSAIDEKKKQVKN